MSHIRIPTHDSIRADILRRMPAAIVTDDLVGDVLTAVVAHREARAAKREAHIKEILARPFTTFKLPTAVADHNRAMLERALRLAAKGFLVIPAHRFDPVAGCTAAARWYRKLARKGDTPDGTWVAGQAKRSKFPVGVRWQERASSNFEAIWQSFNEYPAAVYVDGQKTGDETTRQIDFAVNLSIVTGQRAGYFVVDLDGDEGVAAWEAFEAKQGPFPATVKAQSGSGKGFHIFYRLPSGQELHNTASRFGSGGTAATKVDVRSKGGQVIGAGSLHQTGGIYQWIEGRSPFDVALAMVPEPVRLEAVACSKVAQQEEAQRNGTAIPGPVKDNREDGEDVEAEYVAHNQLPGGVENRIAQIGYGEGTAECINAAVFSAVLSFMWQRGHAADTADLEARITARIVEATKERPDKRARYTDKAYVPGVIKDAKDKAKRWGYAERKAWAFVSMEEAEKAIPDTAKKDADFLLERIANSPKLTALHVVQLAKKMRFLFDNATADAIKSACLAMRKTVPDGLDDDIVEEFNRDFAVYEGPKTEILVLQRAPGKAPDQLDQTNFLARTQALRVVGQTKNGGLIRAGRVWLDSQERNVIVGMGYAPPGAPPLPVGVLNLWNGYPVLKDMRKLTDEELTHACRHYLAHLKDNICCGDVGGYNWLLDFIADIYQVPGHKLGTSLVLVGGFGGGKTTVFEVLEPSFGEFYTKVSDVNLKKTAHNEWEVMKIVKVFEEVVFSGDHSMANREKDAITSDIQLINPKFRTPYRVRDYGRHITCANSLTNAQAMPKGDRRFTVFRTNAAMEELRESDPKSHLAYFKAIREEMEGDGLPAFVELMRHRRYEESTLRTPYRTAAKDVMMRAQADPGIAYLIESIEEGEFNSSAFDEDQQKVAPVRFDSIVKRQDGTKWVALPVKDLMAHFRAALAHVPDRRKAETYCRSNIVLDMMVALVGAHPQDGTAKFGGTTRRVFFVPLRSVMRAALVRAGYLDEWAELDAGEALTEEGADSLDPAPLR